MNASRLGVLVLGVLLALMLPSACASTTSQSAAPHSSPEMPAASSAARDNPAAPEELVPHVSTPASALTDLSAWLDSQHDLRSFSRTELITGTWLVWLRHADDSTLCLEVSDEALRCWREAGQVTRVVPYAWTHRSEPEGFLAVFRDDGRAVFWSLRTRPELQRAHARSQNFLTQARPSWWPSPYRIAPIGVIAIPQRRDLPLTEAPELGPLRWLAVRSLHMQGQGRVAERQDSIVVAGAGERRVLCVRQAAWTCSRPRDVEGTEDEYLDGFDVDGTSIALVRSVQSADVAGSGSAAAHLEFWERREALEFRGSVQVGRATWRPDEVARRRFERVLHSVHVESDLCLRIDDAETAHGPTAVDFNAVGESGVLNLARATQRVEFATHEASRFLDLGGLWRVDATGLTRVNECGSQPRTTLSQMAISSDLEPRAAACLALLNERIDELPRVSIVEGNACGATHYRDGALMGRERFRYDGDRRVENVRVVRLQQGDGDDRYVFRERLLWRGGHRAGEDYESVHYRAGEEECGHIQTRRDTLDGEGRPTRIRLHVQPCEGEERTDNERRRWRREDGFDVGEYDHELHYFVPTYATPVAEVTCSERRCSCHVDVRDESGRVRMRLDSTSPSARVEYLYNCPATPWPESSEELRQLSIETTFGDQG